MRTGETLFLLTPLLGGELLDLFAELWALTLRLNISCLARSLSFSFSYSLSPPPPPSCPHTLSLQTTTKGVGVQGGMVKLATLNAQRNATQRPTPKTQHGRCTDSQYWILQKLSVWLQYVLIVRAVSLARWERKWASGNYHSFTTTVLTYYQHLLAAGMIY